MINIVSESLPYYLDSHIVRTMFEADGCKVKFEMPTMSTRGDLVVGLRSVLSYLERAESGSVFKVDDLSVIDRIKEKIRLFTLQFNRDPNTVYLGVMECLKVTNLILDPALGPRVCGLKLIKVYHNNYLAIA